MNERDAFRLGSVPPLAGRYYNGLELLAEALRGASVELARVVGDERGRVVARRDEALALVDEAQRLQAAAGVDPVEPPEDAAAYEAWAEAVFATVAPALGDGSPAAVVHLLGYVMGEAVATLDAQAILARLRTVTPDHLWMRVQGDSLERERQTAERRLGRLASHPLLSAPVQSAVALAAHRLSERDLRAVEEQATVVGTLISTGGG